MWTRIDLFDRLEGTRRVRTTLNRVGCRSSIKFNVLSMQTFSSIPARTRLQCYTCVCDKQRERIRRSRCLNVRCDVQGRPKHGQKYMILEVEGSVLYLRRAYSNEFELGEELTRLIRKSERRPEQLQGSICKSNSSS